MKEKTMLEKWTELCSKVRKARKEFDELERQKSNMEWSKEFIDAKEADRPKAKYCYELIESSKFSWHNNELQGIPYIKVRRVCLNYKDFEQYINNWGSIMNMPSEAEISPEYYVINNVLLENGGGYCFFKSPQVLTEQQKTEFFAGNFDNITKTWE